jgi:hypothetical protein
MTQDEWNAQGAAGAQPPQSLQGTQPLPPQPQPQPGLPPQPLQGAQPQQPDWPSYPPGTSIPVDQWFHQDLQQRLQSTKKRERAVAERDALIAQAFPEWRIYPVKVGRWRLKLYGLVDPGNGWGDDPISAVLFLLYLVYLLFWFVGWALFGFGRWVRAANVVQVLDPATGRPIAELIIGERGGSSGTVPDVADNGTLAFLGDPRVCGLVGQPTPQGPVMVRGNAFRRDRKWSSRQKDWTAQAVTARAPALMAAPYREYPDSRTGPWLVDQVEQPRGGRVRWTRLGRHWG